MTEDRELLEAAAKAAGITLAWSNMEDQWPRETATWKVWNPLEDDGDAFRLAVKLQIRVCHYGDVVAAGRWTGDKEEECWTGLTGADPYAATRRAIVRAAAELSKQGA